MRFSYSEDLGNEKNSICSCKNGKYRVADDSVLNMLDIIL